VHVTGENPGPTISVAYQWAHNGDNESSSDPPVAVARYRTGARTLTAGELTRILAVVEERAAGAAKANAAAGRYDHGGTGRAPSGRVTSGRATQPAVAIPLVLQRYVAPGEGARHVTTFMMAGTSVMCETFQCAYHGGAGAI
jgi:hypothetical protein